LAFFRTGLALEAFLDRVASKESAPAGGSVAAIAVAMAAGLVAKTARLSPDWPSADETVERAETLRTLVTTLAQADADVYTKVLEALRRKEGVAPALSAAADVPLAIAEAAAEVASLAALAGADGNPRLRGDAVMAVELAAAGARGAAELVAINLAGKGDERVRRAAELAVTAAGERRP
jgi:methenyltetrahydrofolate cyclohydrolase